MEHSSLDGPSQVRQLCCCLAIVYYYCYILFRFFSFIKCLGFMTVLPYFLTELLKSLGQGVAVGKIWLYLICIVGNTSL